jgi:benzaldehyde dehydrogenase (NAD)
MVSLPRSWHGRRDREGDGREARRNRYRITRGCVSGAATAREAQKEWAKVPGPKRGDVLREFSRLMLARSEEIADQIVRETGSIWAKAQWEIQMASREFLEAAVLGSQPQGILTADLEVGRHSA